MIKMKCIILLFIICFNFLWAENIDIEVYLTTEYKGDVNLNVDGKDMGTLPGKITNLPTGYHKFEITWIDENGERQSKWKEIKITSKDKRIYLSTPKVKSKEWVPFLCGFLCGIVGFWVTLSNY